MTPESQLCIIAACDKRYENYIPLFIFSAIQAYPDATIRVFLGGRASKRTKRLLGKMQGNFRLQDGYPCGNSILAAKAMRWLVYFPEFEEYEYIYIGDIDLLICHESDGIVNPHLRHCAHLGLPYSTKMRAHQERISALVFAHSSQWYDAMRPVIDNFRPKVIAGEYDIIKSDERLLYKMVLDSGLGLPPTVEERDDPLTRYHPHHGLHLTTFKDEAWFERCIQHSDYRFLQTEYPKYWQTFRERVLCHDLFAELVEGSGLESTIARLTAFCGE